MVRPAFLHCLAVWLLAAATAPSAGISHVIVGGTFVVRDGALVADALPGHAVRIER